MNDGQWERVKELFHQAAKRPVEERAEFLDAECGDDVDLRSEVEQLLASHDEIGDDSIAPKGTTPEAPEAHVFPVEGPGSIIGRYKPLEEIGEGGMGVVYLAQQEQPVRRKVALKIIKLGMDTKEVIARFEAERQALAIMDHTHIARVFDAGTTELGRPYFVMEYIAGVPITDYCDQHRLDARERLNLFLPVCHAIHHAHQKGIIHRDVKPSNVLVTVQDGKPVPKVIDFGVAKAVNQRLTEKTIFTDHGVLIGTPVYMSPEQADMTGLNVDTTTDVYSLGTLLYELLAGAPPFDPKSLREAGFEAIQRLIRDVEPPKPSTRFSGLGDEGTTVAERRRTEPATLERLIRGELDWITMRAMEKDRTRRYQSASEFAADIERYLRDEPVEAGPPSRTYRMRKFVRRHKAGVGLAAAAGVIIVAFAATMTIQADRIALERDRAELEARRSRLDAEIVRAVLDDSEPLDNQSKLDNFVLLVREAWELDQRSLAGDAAGLALSAVNMIPMLDLIGIWGGDDRTEIEKLREEIEPVAYDMIEQAIAERDTSIFRTVDLMIFRLEDRERNVEPETEGIIRLYRGALTLCRQTLPPDDPYLAQCSERFAVYLEKIGRQALDEDRASDAEMALREALELRNRAKHKGDPYATTQGRLGESLTKLGRYSEAEPLLLESLEALDTRDARLRLIELYESWDKPERADHFSKDLMVASVRELGPIWTPEVGGRHRCSSGEFEGRSVWVFRGHRDGRWAWTDDLNAVDGIRLFDPFHAVDVQPELVSLNAGERAYNDAHSANDQTQWYLIPGAVIADPDRDRALVLYGKFLDVPDGARKRAGFSLAVWQHPDSAVVRPIVSPESDEPTLLFKQGVGLHLDAGVLVDGGYLYLYSATYVSCAVARAPLADALDPDAWRFYAGDGKWSKDASHAVGVLSGQIPIVSVHWNEYLQKYLAVHGDPSKNGGIYIRTADRPEGPWSPARQIFEGLPSELGTNHGQVAHPEFSRDGGRIEYMTYNHPNEPWKREVRLVEVTFR